MKIHTEIWFNRCSICGCAAFSVTADEFRDGEAWTGLRVLGSAKTTRGVRRLMPGDGRYREALTSLVNMASKSAHAESARKLLQHIGAEERAAVVREYGDGFAAEAWPAGGA